MRTHGIRANGNGHKSVAERAKGSSQLATSMNRRLRLCIPYPLKMTGIPRTTDGIGRRFDLAQVRRMLILLKESARRLYYAGRKYHWRYLSRVWPRGD